MNQFVRLVGPHRAVEFLGIRLVGFNAENGKKLLFTFVFVAVVILTARLLRTLASRLSRGRNERVVFWTRQGIALVSALLLVVGLASLWFDDPTRLATALGLVTAGLASRCRKQ